MSFGGGFSRDLRANVASDFTCANFNPTIQNPFTFDKTFVGHVCIYGMRVLVCDVICSALTTTGSLSSDQVHRSFGMFSSLSVLESLYSDDKIFH
jgi:hypothetical protein